MPKRSSKPKPRDINALAASIVVQATNEKSVQMSAQDEDTGKNPAAVALGKLGGLKGGKARADKLSPKKRSDIAKKAAKARWAKKQQKDENIN